MNKTEFVTAKVLVSSQGGECKQGEILVPKKYEPIYGLFSERDVIVTRFPGGHVLNLKVTGMSQFSEECCMNVKDLSQLGADIGIDVIDLMIPSERKQYQNLRNCFTRNLILPILGKDYYNMGMDVYACDNLTTEDILAKYTSLKIDAFQFKTLLLVSILFNIGLLVAWLLK